MTLAELSPAYSEAAQQIGQRLKELRQAYRTAPDEEQRRAFRYRIAELKPIYTQCRELAALTAHYYDRSFRRDAKYTL